MMKATILSVEESQKHISGFEPKKGNHTICALAAAADMPFSEAEEYAQECSDQDPEHKQNPQKYLNYVEQQGKIVVQKVPLPVKKLNPFRVKKYNKTHWNKVSLDRFVEAYPHGRFCVQRNDHALAIIDGVVIDPFGEKPLTGRSLINKAWKIEKPDYESEQSEEEYTGDVDYTEAEVEDEKEYTEDVNEEESLNAMV